MEPKIDQGFQGLIPPATEEELKGLEESLLTEGCRDELIVWGETLLDGHNRIKLCQKHKIKYMTRFIDLPDRDAAKLWIICNQLGRRNITPEQRKYLMGIQYKLEKHQGERTDLTSDQNDQKLQTAERIADQHHVSPATVRRAEKYAEAVDKLPEEERKEALAGKSEKKRTEIVAGKKGGGKKCGHEEKRNLDKERMGPEFKKTYEAFYEEARKAKVRKWKETSKESALNCVQWLHDLITIN